jgi:N-methylhydantoinase A
MVDMHTIGAGGGSIARVDEGGMLAVGPQSAGADPGPACYGRGGVQATVTDANLVLGRLRPAAFLGGGMQLDVDNAHAAIGRLAAQMQVSSQQAAAGVIALANEHMVQALRVISVQRGVDPSAYTLTAFGGAGGLHVCALAEALGIRSALVPVHAGVLSALGMLAAPRGRQLSHTVRGLLREQSETGLGELFRALHRQGVSELLEEGIEETLIEAGYSLDLRYHGQSYTLNVPFHSLDQAMADFNSSHLRRFGHKLDTAVELVNVRLSLSAASSLFSLQEFDEQPSRQPVELAELAAVDRPVPVWQRKDMEFDKAFAGPLLVIDAVATSYVAPEWIATRHRSGCLLLEHAD